VPPLMARWEPSKCSPIWCEAGGRRGAPSLGPSQAEPLGMFWSPLLVTVLLTACLPRPGALLWGRAPRHWLPPWGATLPTHGAGAGETEAGPSEVPSRNGQGAVWEAEGAPGRELMLCEPPSRHCSAIPEAQLPLLRPTRTSPPAKPVPGVQLTQSCVCSCRLSPWAPGWSQATVGLRAGESCLCSWGKGSLGFFPTGALDKCFGRSISSPTGCVSAPPGLWKRPPPLPRRRADHTPRGAVSRTTLPLSPPGALRARSGLRGLTAGVRRAHGGRLAGGNH